MPTYILRDLDPDLWAHVKAHSRQQGIPLREVLVKLLTAYVINPDVIVANSTAHTSTIPAGYGSVTDNTKPAP
jgi:hypothetical protein